MKKITVDKNEGIAEIIDRILAVADSEVMLVIPRGSALAKSASNFRLLKREADSAEKTITIESVDETILDFAGENGMESGHSFLKSSHATAGVSDIVVKSETRGQDDEAEARPTRKTPAIKLTVRAEEETEGEEAEDDDDGKRESFFGGNRFFKDRAAVGGGDDDDDESRGISGKAIAWIVGVLVILAAAFYVVTAVFGHAQITIDFTQTPWTYQNNFVADKSVSTIDSTNNIIPAQVFTTQKNVTQLFPATGASASVSTKAQGTITIYNDYSSASQDLVATTRFVTPDGKIFRLVNSVTVPGAQVSGTAIAPSSITAQIVADQGGPAYNVGPVAKLTIPGFENSPGKYAGFYGAITGQTTGGFIGTKPIPTAADIANAKTKTTGILQSDLQDGLTASYPNNFKILDGATDIKIDKLTVNTSTDANGNFSVFGAATLQAIGFDEAALKTYLLTQGATSGITAAFKDVTLNYSNVQANFTKGQVSFALAGQGTIEPAFSPDDFAGSVAGKSIGDARQAIAALPQLSDGKISVWPIWLWSMPSNPKKIQVSAN